MTIQSRSHGSYLLRRSGDSVEQIMANVHASAGSVSMWRSGQRSPGNKFRERFLEVYGIPSSAWDEPAKPLPAPPSLREEPRLKSTPRVPLNARATAAALSDTVRDLMASLSDPDSDATPVEKAKMASAAAAALTLLGKLTGEIAPLTTERILRSPQWREILRASVAALKPYPDAMRAFNEELRRLEN